MTLNVTPAAGDSTPDPTMAAESPQGGATGAPAGSPLFDLSKMYERFTSSMYLDLEVPHWREATGLPVFVRYGMPDVSRANRKAEELVRAKSDELEIVLNCDVLVNACIGVFVEMPDGAKVGLTANGDPTKPWPKFDHTLAEALGLPIPTAIACVQAVYGFGLNGKPNGVAIEAACISLSEWAKGERAQQDADFSKP